MLNEVERFYLESNIDSMQPQELADKLKHPLELIEKEIILYKQRKAVDAEKAAPKNLPVPNPPKTPLLNTFATKTKGTCIMTPSAAEISDELERERKKKTPYEERPDCVQPVRK